MLGIGQKRELPTVLLIDDDLVSREVIATVLTLHGHLIYTADNGEGALEMLAAGTVIPGVILVDAQLPGLSGIALLEQLRKRSQAAIYVISGSAVSPELTAAADGLLLKPFGPEDLQRLLAGVSRPEVPAPATEDPAINPETLAQFRHIMTEATVREIYVALLTDLKKRVTALEKAIADGNTEEIMRIGHAIKGGCGMAGALEVAHMGAFFEAKSDQLDNCAAAMPQLFTATRKLERMLEKEFPA